MWHGTRLPSLFEGEKGGDARSKRPSSGRGECNKRANDFRSRSPSRDPPLPVLPPPSPHLMGRESGEGNRSSPLAVFAAARSSILPATEQSSLRLQPASMTRGFQKLYQLGFRGSVEVRQRFRGVILRRQADEVADVVPSPLEGCAFPARNSDPTESVHIKVGWARQTYELLLVCGKGCAFRFEAVAIDPSEAQSAVNGALFHEAGIPGSSIQAAHNLKPPP